MTVNTQTQIQQGQGAKIAQNGPSASGALQAGGIGGQQGMDFISMILSRLQANGSLPQSDATSPMNASDTLKSKLTEIISQFGTAQTTAETPSQVGMLQNGAALPQAVNGGQVKNADALADKIVNTLQNTSQSVSGQTGLMNNGLLAQQLGLNPANDADAEILAAVKDVFAEMGIQLNGEKTASAQTIVANTEGAKNKVQAGKNQNTSGAPVKTAQNDTPVIQDTTAPAQSETQAAAQETLTGEDFLLNQQTATSNTALQTTDGKSFQTVEVAMKNAQRSAQSPAAQGQNHAAAQTQSDNQKMVPGQNNMNQLNNGAAQNGSAQPSSSPSTANADGMMTAQTPSPNGQNSAPGASPSPGFQDGLDFLNGFGQQNGESLDAEIAQQIRQEQSQGSQRAAMQSASGSQYRPGSMQQSQIMRAVTLNMTRGNNNAIQRMTMQLEPAELGRVQVDLKMGDDGNLKAHILTDKADTLTLMQKDTNALQKALSEAGLDVGSESFSFDLRQDQNDQQLAQDKNSREMLFDLQGIENAAEDDLASDHMISAAYGQNYIRPSGVNIYV